MKRAEARILAAACVLLLYAPPSFGEPGPLSDPGLEKSFSALYRTRKPGGASGDLLMTVERSTVEGTELYRMRFLEPGQAETNAAVTAEGLLPIIVEKRLNGERVYTVEYAGGVADVFIPLEKLEESQKAIPFVFRKLLGLLSTDTTDEIEPAPDGALRGREGHPGPSAPQASLARRVLAHQEASGWLPEAGRDTQRRFRLPPETVAVQSLPIALAGFPFGRTDPVRFPVAYFPHPMVVWKMKAAYEGEEEVIVPAGRIACHKITLQTDERFSRFAFGDKTHFWLRKEAPHILVKHTHPFAGETSELVSYRTWDGRD